jgi:ankyrin repeat protein
MKSRYSHTNYEASRYQSCFDRYPQSIFLQTSLFYWNSHEQKGNTALIAATEKNNPAIVKLLLEAGADKEAKDNVSIPI